MTEKLVTLLGAFADELRNDKVIAEYQAAKEAYVSDEEATSLIREYNVQQMLKEDERKKENPDDSAIKAIEARSNELLDGIQSNAALKRMKEAEAELDSLISMINSVISNAISPSSCGGDCGSCGGCH